MELNLIDQLTLLSLDDKKGTMIPNSIAFSYAIAGAVVMELALAKKIGLREHKVAVLDERKTGHAVIDACFEKIIASKKEKKINYWVEHFGNNATQLKNETIDRLIQLGLLTVVENKILWVFTTKKYPAQNSRAENKLRRRLYDVIVNHHRPELKEVMLLNLIKSCDLGREVFGKGEAKAFKNRLKSMNEEMPVAGEISKTIIEVYDAIMALLVIMIATTVTTTTLHN